LETISAVYESRAPPDVIQANGCWDAVSFRLRRSLVREDDIDWRAKDCGNRRLMSSEWADAAP
jgi:hypothetical protein